MSCTELFWSISASAWAHERVWRAVDGGRRGQYEALEGYPPAVTFGQPTRHAMPVQCLDGNRSRQTAAVGGFMYFLHK